MTISKYITKFTKSPYVGMSNVHFVDRKFSKASSIMANALPLGNYNEKQPRIGHINGSLFKRGTRWHRKQYKILKNWNVPIRAGSSLAPKMDLLGGGGGQSRLNQGLIDEHLPAIPE